MPIFKLLLPRKALTVIIDTVNQEKSERALSYLVLAALFSTTIFVAPWSVTHPYSIPKLIPLVSFAFALIPLLVTYLKTNWILLRDYRLILSLLFCHSISLLIVLVYPQSNFFQELYGIWGRSNGFLTFMSFTILMTAAIFFPLKRYLSLFIKMTLIVGSISLVYGILQFFKLVRIDKIEGGNIQSVGFYGNENFYSAFIGIICSVAISLALEDKINIFRRTSLVTLVVLGMVGIFLANSQQGFFVFFVGLLIVVLVKLKTSQFKLIFFSYLITSMSVLIAIIFGFLQIGPLKAYVYEETLTFRGYYWRAGLRTFLENPLLGVGFDGYRDWYRRSRAEGATTRLQGNDIADSAHNYFIDIAAFGGLILLITYLALFFYVIYCSIKIILHLKVFDASIIAVISAWYAFTTQTFFSIIQPGLTIWGWVLAGLIISIYKSQGTQAKAIIPKSKIGLNGLRILTFFILGFFISVQPFIASSMYRQAVEQQDTKLLIKAANRFPQESNMLTAAAGALIGLGKYQEARELLYAATSKFPNFYEAWYIYSLLPDLTEQEIKTIEVKFNELEPLLKKKKELVNE